MNLAMDLARTGEGAKAGPIGLAVILLLCIACYFLFKSMSKHLKRVREEFPTDTPPAGATAGAAKVSTVKATAVTSAEAAPTTGKAVEPPADTQQ